MKDQNVTKAELARRLGVSKPWITKLLDGNHNLTMKSLLNVALALGLELNVTLADPTKQGINLNACDHDTHVPAPDEARSEVDIAGKMRSDDFAA